MELPPDRAEVATEARNPRSRGLHRLGVAELVALIQDEDRAVVDAMAGARADLIGLIAAAEPGFLAGGRLIYLGAGTSGRLGVLDASEAPPTFDVPHGRVIGLIAGGDAALTRSSEGKEDDPRGAHAELDALGILPRDTVIGVAAGGSTPYVLGGCDHARARGAAVVALIACVPIPARAALTHRIALLVGPEVLTGSTRMKAGTATKLALNTISTALMVRAGKVYDNLMVDVRATNAKLRDRAARIISALTGLDRAGAFAALEEAGGAATTAVAMRRLGLDRGAAEALLGRHGGHLGRALGESDGPGPAP